MAACPMALRGCGAPSVWTPIDVRDARLLARKRGYTWRAMKKRWWVMKDSNLQPMD